MADSDIGYPSDAYHDPNTGFFTKPEHVDGTDKEFTEVATADGKPIWVPRPHFKPVRRIQFGVPHSYLNVFESMDRCKEFIDLAKVDEGPVWIVFTDPIFGTPVEVHRDQLKLAIWVLEGQEDLDSIKLQMEANEHNKNVLRMQALANKKQNNRLG